MKKIIVREDKFNAILKELNEPNGQGKLDMLMNPSAFSIVADRFKRYSQEIEMFIEEFNTLYQVMSQSVGRLGLVLINQDVDDDFEETPMRGASYKYIFGIGEDPRSYYENDEAYDDYVRRIKIKASELEDDINPRHYNACSVRVQVDEEITVSIEFNLWD